MKKHPMWQWISQNAQSLSFFASLGTLLVWLFYAHLLFAAFRRQRKARILVNQGWGQQIDSVCLLANMSQEPIYIHSILLTIYARNDQYTASITDFDSAESGDSGHRGPHVTRQGPLQAGAQINLGTFRTLIRQTAKQNENLTQVTSKPIAALEVDRCLITVIATYGPEGGLIGAQREFSVSGTQNDRLKPVYTTTTRLARRSARRRLRNWLEEQHL